jgi:hypothetical protein
MELSIFRYMREMMLKILLRLWPGGQTLEGEPVCCHDQEQTPSSLTIASISIFRWRRLQQQKTATNRPVYEKNTLFP